MHADPTTGAAAPTPIQAGWVLDVLVAAGFVTQAKVAEALTLPGAPHASAPSIAQPLAQLRHLYAQMVGGAVKDSAQCKRIAEGILGRAIESLEHAIAPAPAQPGEREHHAALQRIGTALGLLPGADLHRECVPAIERLIARIPCRACGKPTGGPDGVHTCSPQAPSVADEALRSAGAKLANIAFNLAQRPGEPLTSDMAEFLHLARVQWDEALRTRLQEKT